MSAPVPNMFQEFLANAPVFGLEGQFKERWDINGDEVADYYGICLTPNGSLTEPIWMIWKFDYAGANSDVKQRRQLPDNGFGLKYVWNDRATYFS